ncbi:sensor histidine kinase [Nonomuraea polychroma]|uniref:sensor histidine kinase n=1 Tax=Nonomuraea polychroma TaxID=46176 RepID=UPI003D8B3DBA
MTILHAGKRTGQHMFEPFSSDRANPGEQCTLRHLKTSLLDRQRQFATDASHELRSPLAAPRVQVEAAQSHPDDVDLPDLLNHVTNGFDRLEGVVDDLLLLATIEPDLDRTREDVDLTALVETVVARWDESADIRLGLEPAVTMEAAACQLANLLDNAQRHAVHGLKVGLRRTGDHAELTVADDGKGISPADRERLCQPFTLLDTTRSRTTAAPGWAMPSPATSPRRITAA